MLFLHNVKRNFENIWKGMKFGKNRLEIHTTLPFATDVEVI